jgi:hypothetical protein
MHGLATADTIPRIGIKGSRFRLNEDGAETVLDAGTIEVVIVGANPNVTKTWYAEEWSPDADPQAPDCFSMNGTTPSTQAQSPQSDLCSSCEHNAWGSKVTTTGQKLKACPDTKRLAIVAADDPSGTVYLLSVSPSALKGLNQYQRELSSRGIPPEIVRTKVSFDTSVSFPKILFGFGGFLDEEAIGVIESRIGSDEVKAVTGEEEALTLEPEPATKTKSEPKPKPEPEPELAPAPEPATKKGFGAAKPKAKPELAPAPEPATKKGFGAAKPKAKPEPATSNKTEDTQAMDLSAEIAALVGMADDDA